MVRFVLGNDRCAMLRTVNTFPSSRFACQSIPPAVSIFTTLILDPRLIIPGPPSSFQSVECLVGNKKPRKRSRRRARVPRGEQKWLFLFPLRAFGPAKSTLPPRRFAPVPSGDRGRFVRVVYNKKGWRIDCVTPLWSGKRDSNSRPRPWQGRALPTELFPQMFKERSRGTGMQRYGFF